MDENYTFIDELRAAPRINALLTDFEAIAAGKTGRPRQRVPLRRDLLGHDALACTFGETMMKLAGHFEEHIAASVPWMREERARYGAALWRYGQDLAARRRSPATVYTTSGAEGTEIRALAALAQGHIEALSCSPNAANQEQFHTCGAPDGAYFFLGPYYEVTLPELARRGLPQFGAGFDVIVEETTFQMYHPSRHEQIGLLRRSLKSDGILMLLEKLNANSPDEYARRERQKDDLFKTRYFDQDQIAHKRASILGHMDAMQVSMPELTAALRQHFRAAVILFNSGNFYHIAASNNPGNLARLVAQCIPPATPPAFMYHRLPEILFSPPGYGYVFRPAFSG